MYFPYRDQIPQEWQLDFSIKQFKQDNITQKDCNELSRHVCF